MSLGAWSRNHGSLDGSMDAIISLESWEINGCWFDQIIRFLHLWHQCTWDRYSNHGLVSFVGKSAKGTMKQLSSENYDLSGSRCCRQISHFIRNPALTRCSSSISFINLLGQQTSPLWLFLGRSTSNIQMLLFQPCGVPFYLGFLGQGTWKTRCSFTFFWLCVTVPSGPLGRVF